MISLCSLKRVKRNRDVQGKLLCSPNILTASWGGVGGGGRGGEGWGRGGGMFIKVTASSRKDPLVLLLLVSGGTACKIFLAGHFRFLLNKIE